MTEPRHIKPRERVRDLGEVYTQRREVDAMLNLISDAFDSYGKLTDMGVIDVGNMTDAIQKFRYFEKKSIEGLVQVGDDASRLAPAD